MRCEIRDARRPAAYGLAARLLCGLTRMWGYIPGPGQYIPVPGYRPKIGLSPILGEGMTIGNIKI